MFKSLLKCLFKFAVVAGLVLGVVAVLRYIEETSPDYIEIYNDNLDEDGDA